MSTETTPLMSSETPLIENNDSNEGIVENNGHTEDPILAVPTRFSFFRNLRHYKIIITLIISVALALASGTLYGFGRYSRALKESLGLSQRQVEQFGILLDTGSYISHPLTGFVYDHFGPRISCLSAALVVFAAYGMIHTGVTYHIESNWIFGLSFFFVGFGSGLGYIAGLGSTTKNFQSTRHLSLAVGVVASGYGLSSTLVGITYNMVGLKYFFLLWAFICMVANLVAAYEFTAASEIETEVEGDESDESDEDHEDPSISLRHLNHDSIENVQRKKSHIHADDSEERNVDLLISEESIEMPTRKWYAWRTIDFWLLFTIFTCCTGCGLFVINNVSTMVQSMGGKDTLAGELVILLSLSNCSGRLLIGFLADRPQFSKLFLLGAVSCIMAIALFSSAVATSTIEAQVSLAFTVALVAASYGGTWVIVVLILSDWFGNKDFGKNYGLIAMGPALSGMFFNTISARIYEKHASEHSGVCLGTVCYRGSFFLTSAAAVFGLLLIPYLAYRRR